MSFIARFQQSKGSEDSFFVRAVSLVGGSFYPLWSVIYQYVFPYVDDSIWRRGLLSLLSFAIAGATFVPRFRKYTVYGIYVMMFLASTELLYISHLNRLDPYCRITWVSYLLRELDSIEY